MSLYKGSKLKRLVSENATVAYTQTAAQAVDNIIKKFGKLEDNVFYYHRGNGIWSKYSLTEDRKKNSKIAANNQRWKKEPWRYDLKKIDTKEGLTIKRAEVKQKKPKHNKQQKTTQVNIFAKF